MPKLASMISFVLALFLTPALAGPTADTGSRPLQTLEGHARRGAVLARLDGLAAESAPACQAACALNTQCQAWTWNTGWIGQAARCDIHALALTPRPKADAVTGLAPDLTARINAAIDRPPSNRERAALDEVGGPARSADRELAGG
jgi:hypothetical protein